MAEAADNCATGHMLQLDGLRAFAALSVVLFHYLGAKHPFNQILPWGALGVELFFVLSGFLITGILLRCKAQVETGEATLGRELSVFYLRRSLRIFPIYYLTLLLVWLADIGSIRETIAWHATYTSNVYFQFKGAPEGPLAHLWSLSVEEQFYLVWPWAILLVPRKHLEALLVGAIALAPISRMFFWYISDRATWGGSMPTSCLETLGIGALLAFYRDPRSVDERKRERLAQLGFWIGLPGLLLLQIIGYALRNGERGLSAALSSPHAMLSALLFVWVVDRCSRDASGLFGKKVLRNSAITFLGKISYALYLFHNFVPSAWKQFHQWSGHHIDLSGTPKVLAHIAISILLASLSWFLFERPISRLKRYFEYERVPQHRV